MNKKSKKPKWLKYLTLFVTLLLLVVVVFSLYQYNQGLSEASDGLYKDDETTFDPFEGAEPQFGEINILLIGSDARGDEQGRL